MAVYGVYNNLVWAWLEEHDATPEFGEGDVEALKNGHPDFIGFNYYNTATCQWEDGTVECDSAADQHAAHRLDLQVAAEPLKQAAEGHA